jgi:hypothetical protein
LRLARDRLSRCDGVVLENQSVKEQTVCRLVAWQWAQS